MTCSNVLWWNVTGPALQGPYIGSPALQGRDRNGVSKLTLTWKGVGSNKPQFVQEALRIGPETSSACLRRAGVTIGMMASLPEGAQPRHLVLCILETKY